MSLDSEAEDEDRDDSAYDLDNKVAGEDVISPVPVGTESEAAGEDLFEPAPEVSKTMLETKIELVTFLQV